MIAVALLMMTLRDKIPTDMVDIRTECPRIVVELRYMTSRNGIHRAVYPKGSRCLLRRGVAQRLERVQARLAKAGLGIKIWDAYRPLSAQRALWEICPDKRFVALPARGSKHNRGAAVDLTLINSNGKELAMPTGFDTFSARAHPDYAGGTREQRHHRDALRNAMMAEGFVPAKYEWWHFHAPDWKRYGLTDVSLRR